MVAAPAGAYLCRLLHRPILSAIALASLCHLGLLLGFVHARGARRLQSLDADHLSAEIYDAGDLHSSHPPGDRRIPALDPRRKNRRMAAPAFADAGTDGGRCLKNGSAFYRWRSCSVRSLSAFLSPSR